MRIIIETEEGGQPSFQREPKAAAEDAARSAPAEEPAAAAPGPSQELAARAAAMDASSAGPAPADLGAEGPSLFVGDPTAPETAPTRGHDASAAMSAGAAPAFATGVLEVETVEADSSAGAAPEHARERESPAGEAEAGGGADADGGSATGEEDG